MSRSLSAVGLAKEAPREEEATEEAGDGGNREVEVPSVVPRKVAESLRPRAEGSCSADEGEGKKLEVPSNDLCCLSGLLVVVAEASDAPEGLLECVEREKNSPSKGLDSADDGLSKLRPR